MTLLYPLAPSSEPEVTRSLGVELGARYEFIGTDGTRAVLNDTTDDAFVGYLTDLSGLDSAEVRETVDLRTAGDGAIHGEFYLGRRPVTFAGVIGPTDAGERNDAITRLQRATNNLRADGLVRWQTTNGLPVELSVRRNDPLRISERAPKRFSFGLVAADPRVYSQSYVNVGVTGSTGASVTQYPGLSPSSDPTSGWDAQTILETRGSTSTPPVVTITGPLNRVDASNGWRIYNATTGTSIEATPNVLNNVPSGTTLTFDYANATVTDNTGTSWYDALDFTLSDFTYLQAGTNDLRFFAGSTSSSTTYNVEWREAWA